MKKGLLVVAGVFSLFAFVAQSTFAAWDKPCDKRKFLKLIGATFVKKLGSSRSVQRSVIYGTSRSIRLLAINLTLIFRNAGRARKLCIVA